MKRYTLILGLAATAAAAQTVNPAAAGYIERSRAMYATGNYTGAIDQLGAIDRDALSPREREQADWLLALASYGESGAAALERFRAFVGRYPYSTERQTALMRIGDCLLEADPAAALDAYGEVDPAALSAADRLALDYRRAYARIMTGDLGAGPLDAMERLSAEPAYRDAASYYAGYILYTRHDYPAASARLSRVAPASPEGPYAAYYMMQIAYAEGDYDSAGHSARAMMAAAALPADYRAEARRIYGESLWHQGKRRQAVKELEAYAGECASPQLSALYLLGINAYGTGAYSRACELLEPVTAADNAMGQTACLYLGEAKMKLGDDAAAILAFDRARSMTYDSDVRQAALYDYAVAVSRGASVPFASSVAVFEEYLRDYPAGTYAPQVQQYIVEGYLTDNNFDAALASIERMRRPSQSVLAAKQQVLYALGSRALARGDDSAAAGYLERSLELRSHSSAVAAQAALDLGEIRYRQGRYDDAISLMLDYLRTAPASDPNHALARYDLGYARLARKDYAEAATNFTKVVDSPGNLDAATVADALNRLADTYYYRRDWQQAADTYARAYRANPAAGDYALFQQGVMQGYRRDHAGKIETLERMMRDFPTSALTPDALLEITESCQQLGRTDRAIGTYRRIIADYPATSHARRARLQLALTLLNAGKRDEARSEYREVVRLYPTSEEAAMAAEELSRMAADDGTLGEHAAFLAGIEGAPALDVAEADRLAFEAAERRWLTDGDASRLARYAVDYPQGAMRPRALAYLVESAGADHEATLRYTAEILTAYPDSPQAEQALLASARAKYALGRGEEALADWQELARRASGTAVQNEARVGIMRVARDLSDPAQMLAAADALLASSAPGTGVRAEAVFTRGLALSLQCKGTEARRAWESIAGDTDDLYGTKAAYYRAESLYETGETAAAQKAVESLTDSATPHTYWLARAFILLSDIHAARGNKFEAREYLRSLRSNYPGDEPDIRRMIETRLEKLK